MTIARRRDEIVSALHQRVQSGLHLGLLRRGERLPSVRDLAQEFDASPRVILAAFQELERDGVVSMRNRSGIYVAQPGPSETDVPGRHAEWLTDLVADGLARGIGAPDLAQHMQRALTTLRLQAVVLDCNDDQLWSMTDELAHDYGLDATFIDLDEFDPGAPLRPELGRADLLVTTSSHAEQVRALAEQLGIPFFAVKMCTELFAEVERLLQREPVYFVVSDARMAAKLHAVFSDKRGAENLRTLTLGEDDLDSVPSAAPVYLTRLTRERLGDSPMFARVIPEARVFSSASAREIISFIVRANSAVMLTKRSAVARQRKV